MFKTIEVEIGSCAIRMLKQSSTRTRHYGKAQNRRPCGAVVFAMAARCAFQRSFMSRIRVLISSRRDQVADTVEVRDLFSKKCAVTEIKMDLTLTGRLRCRASTSCYPERCRRIYRALFVATSTTKDSGMAFVGSE